MSLTLKQEYLANLVFHDLYEEDDFDSVSYSLVKEACEQYVVQAYSGSFFEFWDYYMEIGE